MIEIVINAKFGGFGLSDDAHVALGHEHYAEKSETSDFVFTGWRPYEYDMARDDPDLVRVVRDMGDAANGNHAALKVVEIPDGVDWEIEEYDGFEHIAEKHRTWG